ncbi:MAG: CRISPR-associated endonuclease Cas3'', partial [Kiritimatiellaeota bacterium]|nr:CRISPR-associated endonuclease Cas3'' [Kiritimatiellota bacterium]
MSKPLYAHSRKDQLPETWQPLEEHLHVVAKTAADFAVAFASSDWAWNAGWLHDLGKATNAFQAYLRRCNELDDSDYDEDGSDSNHASTGAALAEDALKLPGRILAYLLAGHHAGLPDWHSAVTGNAALPCRLPEGRKNLATIRAYADEIQKRLRSLTRPPDFVRQPERFHLWMRMIFSCLVDADFLNTEEFSDKEKTATRGGFPNLGSLAPRFFQALETLEKNAVLSQVNTLRATIRQACEAAAVKPPGLFSLSVPTGGGKTLSAMAFALRHALQHGKQRIIYVIPYTSIIEQTAGILAGIFGRENVVEHHSNLAPARETERSQMAAENWDAPVIVTTNVQFFESLYAAKPGR